VLSNFRVFVVKKSFAIKYKKITTNPDSQKTVATLLRLPHGRPEDFGVEKADPGDEVGKWQSSTSLSMAEINRIWSNET